MLKIPLRLMTAALLCLAQPALSAEEVKSSPIYVSMHPHFLTNLAGDQRFVQIKAQALVANPETETALRLHMPAVRHQLLMLLGDLHAEDLRGVEQKQKFLDNAVSIMRDTLARYEADGTDVEGMFITSMVIQ